MIDYPIFAFIILPLLIFIARIADVSLGTLRIVFISKGKKNIAPIIGFFEVLIWLIAIGQIFSNLDNVLYYIAYSLGFASGTYVGLFIEEKLSLGLLNIQLILEKKPDRLIKALDERGYGITMISAEGSKSNLNLIIIVIKRKNLNDIIKIIGSDYPNAFISIEEVQSIKGGNIPLTLKKSQNYRNFRKKGK